MKDAFGVSKSVKSDRNWHRGMSTGAALMGGVVGAHTLKNLGKQPKLATAVGGTWAATSGLAAANEARMARKSTVKLKKLENFKSSVSKIAMRPVYHGTTKAGATKLKRLISSKTPDTASFKYVVGKPRTDGTKPKAGDTRPEGLYTTTSRESAEHYSITGRSPDSGGLSPRNNRGRVMVFNSVGVKPKYAGMGEEIYDPKKLGHPLAVRSFKRAKEGKAELKRKETMDRVHDEGVADFRGRAHPAENYFASIRYGESNGWKSTAEIRAAGRKKIFGDQPKPRKRAQPPAGGWPKNDFV